MSTKTKSRGMLGSILVVSVVALAAGTFVNWSSESREIGDQEYNRERRAIVRWEVEMTRPANIVVITNSSYSGPNKDIETAATGALGENISLSKKEKLTITVSGELPVSDRRGSISCRIYIDSKRVAYQTRTVRAGESANGVVCRADAIG